MTGRSRQQALMYLALAILGLGILAASLSDLKLEPGLPIPGSTAQVLVEPGDDVVIVFSPEDCVLLNA